MTRSQSRMPVGKPFKKGDPRINRLGGISKEKRAFKEEFDKALAKRVDMEVLVEKLASLAERGTEWAMKEVLERTMGKVTQPVGGELTHTLRFKFGDNNGNGEGNGNDK